MKIKKTIFLAVLFFGYFVVAKNSWAAEIQAVSCNQVDVQAAIDSAQDGDIVNVPAGECEWDTPHCYDGSNFCAAIQIVDKSIFLKGAGSDRTIITNRIPYLWNNTAIHVKGQKRKPVRISGLTLSDISSEFTSRFFVIDGEDNSWRIDNSKFMVSSNKFGGYRYIIFPYTYGLIDHCDFTNALVNFKNSQDGAVSWSRPISLGTGNATYVEDSTFYYEEEHGQEEDFIDGEAGGRVVIRKNNITNAQFHFHGIEGGSLKGIHSYELYQNTINGEGSINNYRKGGLRGGTGVIYDNNWTGTFTLSSPFYLVHQCLYIQKDPDDHRCDGAKWCYGYPCPDQIGRTSDADHDGKQDLAPLFSWNNYNDGYKVELNIQSDVCPECIDYIQEKRDFYNDTDINGKPIIMNSQTGYYIAQYRDDDGSIKEWQYKPYIYPHPLAVVSFGEAICEEGEINSPCWCQGIVRSSGSCDHGYYFPVADAVFPASPAGLSVK